jgi:hypothetical protein
MNDYITILGTGNAHADHAHFSHKHGFPASEDTC